MKIKTRYLIITLIGVIVATFFIGWLIGHKRAVNASNDTISALNSEISSYVIVLKEKETYVSEIEQELKTQKELIKDGDIEKKELKAINIKKVSEITSLKAQIRLILDSIKPDDGFVMINVPNPDTIYTIDQNAILLPVSFSKKSEFYDFKINIDTEANLGLDLTVPVVLNVITGWDKYKKGYKSVVTSNNPHFKVIDINSSRVTSIKPKRFSIGLQSGYGVMLGNPLRSGFYVGGGISYGIIRW